MRKWIFICRDGIGFSFWHRYGKGSGTLIRIHRLRTGLFGIRFARCDTFKTIHALQIGCWWGYQFSIMGMSLALFNKKR